MAIYRMLVYLFWFGRSDYIWAAHNIHVRDLGNLLQVVMMSTFKLFVNFTGLRRIQGPHQLCLSCHRRYQIDGIYISIQGMVTIYSYCECCIVWWKYLKKTLKKKKSLHIQLRYWHSLNIYCCIEEILLKSI